MVSYIHVALDDDLFKRVNEVKGERTWTEFFLDIVKEKEEGKND